MPVQEQIYSDKISYTKIAIIRIQTRQKFPFPLLHPLPRETLSLYLSSKTNTFAADGNIVVFNEV